MRYFLALLAFSFLTIDLHALYSGNPMLPEMIEEGLVIPKDSFAAAKIGYQRDYVSDRKMDATSKLSGEFDDFSYVMDQGVATLNLIDRFEFYASFGAMKIEASQSPAMLIEDTFITHSDFTWGAGGRVLINQWKALTLGLDGKYQYAAPDFRFIGVNGTPFSPTDGHISYKEWQIALALAYQVDIFIPYIAVKYSNVTATFKNLPNFYLPSRTSFGAKNRTKFGMALGTSLTTGRLFSLDIEARMIDETAFTIAGELRF